MSSEHPAETSVTLTLPDDVSDWLDARAENEGVDREELLVQLLAAYRLTVEEDENGLTDVASPLAHIPDEDEIRTQTIEEMEKRTRELESTFQALVADVRERVIQVKREADAKAPKDHEHEALTTWIESMEGEVATLQSSVADVAGRIDRLDRRFDDGFENYESVLTELVDTMDAIEERVTKLATVVVDLRSDLGTLQRNAAEREQLGTLLDSANQHGIRTATCDSCQTKVDLALLRAPACPHCDSHLSAVEPKRGLFGSHTLHTDDRPALESPEDRSNYPSDADELFAERLQPSNASDRGDDGESGR